MWLFDWFFPQFCKSDMLQYRYLEVFQRVCGLRDNEIRLYIFWLGSLLYFVMFYSSQWFYKWTVRVLNRLHRRAGWSGPLLSVYARRYVFTWHGLYVTFCMTNILYVNCRGVGCIFYEMACGRPIFPGSTVEDELHLIFKTLGTPTDDMFPGISTNEEFLSYNLPHYEPEPLINIAPR